MSLPECLATGFEDAVTDPASSVAVDLKPATGKLLVFFGGFAGGLLMPPFEFLRMTGSAGCSRVFLRDLDQVWYHSGLRGVTADVPETVSLLDSVITESRAEDVLFAGNSMGGYAAILFGSLVSTRPRVAAFAPQTFIGPARRFFARDRRWADRARAVAACPTADRRLFDLRNPIRNQPAPPHIEIHYPVMNRLDRLHAERLRGLPGVALCPHRCESHMLVKELRDSGELQRILGVA
ncbi:MAG: hypothetical protein FJ224_08760 [Lentisphaerae bacterium]|nr:hypothetical protein [Lentisphaerota bacterium]